MNEAQSTIISLRKELDEVRHDNSRLQDKLCKARSLLTLAQKAAEEARSERDKEKRRAEGLQLTAQQLQKQLRRETAKAVGRERALANKAKSEGDSFSALVNGPEATNVQPQVKSPSQAHNVVDARQSSPAEEIKEEQPEFESDSGLVAIGSSEFESDAGLVSIENLMEPDLPVEADNISPYGHMSSATTVVPPSPSGTNWDRAWEFVVQGQHDPVQQADFAPKLVSCYPPDDAVERATRGGVAFVCSRGRRLDRNVPNQDDFLIARHKLAGNGHIALYGVFDGHGPAGHLCASFVRGAMPQSLFGHSQLLMQPEETLRQVFEETQESLSKQSFDTENSGTTAALALVLNIPNTRGATPQRPQDAGSRESIPEEGSSETWLFVAHVGDSRVILASHLSTEDSTFSVTPLTHDHRPDDATEAERIRQAGGEVRKLHKSSNSVRVFAAGQDRPALAITRAFGSTGAADCGLSADPDISSYQLRPGVDALLLLGTDGLYEFCNHMEAVGQLLSNGATTSALEELCQKSRLQWAQSSYSELVDDITAIAVSFPP